MSAAQGATSLFSLQDIWVFNCPGSKGKSGQSAKYWTKSPLHSYILTLTLETNFALLCPLFFFSLNQNSEQAQAWQHHWGG